MSTRRRCGRAGPGRSRGLASEVTAADTGLARVEPDPQSPVGIVWAAVGSGSLAASTATAVLREVDRVAPLLREEAVPTVTTALVDLATEWGPALMRRLRPRLLAEHGHRGVLDDLQGRLAAAARLSMPHVESADLTEYQLWMTPEQAAALEAAIGPLSAPAPNEETGERDLRPAGQRRVEALTEVCRASSRGDRRWPTPRPRRRCTSPSRWPTSPPAPAPGRFSARSPPAPCWPPTPSAGSAATPPSSRTSSAPPVSRSPSAGSPGSSPAPTAATSGSATAPAPTPAAPPPPPGPRPTTSSTGPTADPPTPPTPPCSASATIRPSTDDAWSPTSQPPPTTTAGTSTGTSPTAPTTAPSLRHRPPPTPIRRLNGAGRPLSAGRRGSRACRCPRPPPRRAGPQPPARPRPGSR